jgi:hypothetical protein
MAHQLAGVFPSWSGGRGTHHDPAWHAAVVVRREVLSSIGPLGLSLPRHLRLASWP